MLTSRIEIRKRGLQFSLGKVPSPVWASDFVTLKASMEETMGDYYGVEGRPSLTSA